METIYFSYCWGVFDGGGVRGAAHAGAYYAARNAGISFERVAGTSAGSIVAALIAAGGSPDFIKNLLIETDFESFLAPANNFDSIFTKKNNWSNLLKIIPHKKIKMLSSVIFNSGVHSSSMIEEWMEKKIVSLLRTGQKEKNTRPVTFRELKIPLHIVATDISTGIPKIWSCEDTPDESVSFAVRCSCTIPIFFQAISNNNSILVDGGVVSNLPSFVFSKLANEYGQYTKKPNIISFTLVQDASEKKRPENILDYMGQLSNAVVSGATEIQKILQNSVYNISINTGSISSTDFKGVKIEDKNYLFDSGVRAVADFIKNERAVIKKGMVNIVSNGIDEKFLLLVQEMRNCHDEFYISGDSSYWLDFLFPSVYSLKKRNVNITCFFSQNETNDIDEIRRRDILRRLGINILFVEKIPFQGFLFSPKSEYCSAVLTTSQGQIYSDAQYVEEKVKLYNSYADAPIIQLLIDKIDNCMISKEHDDFVFSYQNCAEEKIIDRLRNVRQYKNASFSVIDVNVDDNVLVLSSSVKEYKVLQLRYFFDDLKCAGKSVMDLLEVELKDNVKSIVTPPVLEKINDKYIIIDGSARFFYCMTKGITQIKSIVVDNVLDPLPYLDPKP
ncbi:TPA: patatin-like phospholipase family protein, partial [Klebsiella pneumoniae]